MTACVLDAMVFLSAGASETTGWKALEMTSKSSVQRKIRSGWPMMRGQGSPAQPRRLDNPASGVRIAGGFDIYHDATDGEFSCTASGQGRIVLTIYQFAGSYLSLVMAMSKAHRKRARPGQKVLLSFAAASTRPLKVFLRLNLATAERQETRHETLVIREGPRQAVFELAGLDIDPIELRSVWVDMIFSEPEMTEIVLEDLSLEVTG